MNWGVRSSSFRTWGLRFFSILLESFFSYADVFNCSWTITFSSWLQFNLYSSGKLTAAGMKGDWNCWCRTSTWPKVSAIRFPSSMREDGCLQSLCPWCKTRTFFGKCSVNPPSVTSSAMGCHWLRPIQSTSASLLQVLVARFFHRSLSLSLSLPLSLCCATQCHTE